MKWFQRLPFLLRLLLLLLVAILLLQGSAFPPGTQLERARAFTRQIEFDFVSWTVKALDIKFIQSALGSSDYLSEAGRRQVVLDYLSLQQQIGRDEDKLHQIYTAPAIKDPQTASAKLRDGIAEKSVRRLQIAPLAESILQSQISQIAAEMGLSLGGQVVPPILYHSTPLPLLLNISPRSVIRLDESIALTGDLCVDQQVELEQNIEQALGVSALVEEVGGVGLYPTMVVESGDIDWLSEVISHEWVHNYLTLHPLGLNYETTPELRVMNETVASIAGKEIGLAVLKRYYPEFAPPPSPAEETTAAPEPVKQPEFNFNREMHITRVNADSLLVQGKIEEAESYMEARRKVFWEHGYRSLRRLNQAYFAFHGAYADEPGGAAGATEDPVGKAVRLLRSQSPNLAAFLDQISWMTSFEQLQRAVSSTTSAK